MLSTPRKQKVAMPVTGIVHEPRVGASCGGIARRKRASIWWRWIERGRGMGATNRAKASSQTRAKRLESTETRSSLSLMVSALLRSSLSPSSTLNSLSLVPSFIAFVAINPSRYACSSRRIDSGRFDGAGKASAELNLLLPKLLWLNVGVGGSRSPSWPDPERKLGECDRLVGEMGDGGVKEGVKMGFSRDEEDEEEGGRGRGECWSAGGEMLSIWSCLVFSSVGAMEESSGDGGWVLVRKRAVWKGDGETSVEVVPDEDDDVDAREGGREVEMGSISMREVEESNEGIWLTEGWAAKRTEEGVRRRD